MELIVNPLFAGRHKTRPAAFTLLISAAFFCFPAEPSIAQQPPDEPILSDEEFDREIPPLEYESSAPLESIKEWEKQQEEKEN
ncbi:MAG: hypothetical protein HC843_09205 [Sphingomonadales bacterium]|nr:hypothetical protein [Sphingomonadales bacterium]